MARRARRSVLPWLGSALALFAVWMLLVDTREVPQLLAGVVVAAIAAAASELARRQRRARVRLRGGWLVRSWRPLASVPRDLGRLTAAALRAALPGGSPPPGRLRAIAFEPGRVDEDAEPEGVGRSALAQLAGSFSPNTIAIGIDGERRMLLVHQLLPEAGSESLDPLRLGRRRR